MRQDDSEQSSPTVGLFGGSFNPPHSCHTMGTLWALQTHALDEVWWIPTYKHAFSKELLDFEFRHRMAEIATAPLDNVTVSRIEQRLGGESRTIDTVEKLESQHPKTDFALIIGSDILEQTHRWKKWDELMDRVELIVIERRGYPTPVHNNTHFPLPDISSTDIRNHLQQGNYDALQPWIARDVLSYIQANQLYLET